MALNKQQKQKIIKDLREMFSRQKSIILIGIAGLNTKDIFILREKIKSIDGKLKVAKKTLMEIVFKENNLEFDEERFKEEIALVFGFKDEILPVKTIYQFSKDNKKLQILGGYFDGSFKEAEEVITLAQLPFKKELIATLIGSLNSPIYSFINALKGNIKGLIYVLAKAKI